MILDSTNRVLEITHALAPASNRKPKPTSAKKKAAKEAVDDSTKDTASYTREPWSPNMKKMNSNNDIGDDSDKNAYDGQGEDSPEQANNKPSRKSVIGKKNQIKCSHTRGAIKVQNTIFKLFFVLLLGALDFTHGFQSNILSQIRVHSPLQSTLGAEKVEPVNAKKTSNQKVSVLLCPAQFCVPADYEELFQNLVALREKEPDLPQIATCRVASLSRADWIKVARQLPTKNFLDATLNAKDTLGWYFTGIEKSLQEIYALDGPDTQICIIGHSIGGWVARGYLGGVGGSSTAVYRRTREQCTSVVTIGTPHKAPEDALVDQTRGLIRELEETPSCSSQALADLGIEVTCVGSSGVTGSFLTTNPEELVAASSYLPLLGKLDKNSKGDGIVPLDLAFMDSPANKIVVDECSLTGVPVRHSHVLPTPWNLLDGFAPSMKLPDTFVSYVSEGVLPQWSRFIR